MLFAIYSKGKRNGLCCLFVSGQLRLVADYKMDILQAIRTISVDGTVRQFDPCAVSASDNEAQELLAKLEDAGEKSRQTEADLRKRVRDADEELRKQRAAANGVEAAKRIQATIDKMAAEDAVSQSIFLRGVGQMLNKEGRDLMNAVGQIPGTGINPDP